MIGRALNVRAGAPLSVILLLCRVVAGGALLLAGVLKVGGNPAAFALSIEAFRLVPGFLVPPLAFYLPWFEIIVGAALVIGLWGREAAVLTLALYAAFTLGLLSVVLRGMDIDCGCFGGLFGSESAGLATITRNVVLMAMSLGVCLLGSGRFALQRSATGRGKSG